MAGFFQFLIILALASFAVSSAPAAEKPAPVVRYHLGFENNDFLKDDFIAQYGKKMLEDRQIDFPKGRFGKAILMNFIPKPPDGDNMSGIDLDLVTAVMFNTLYFKGMGYNEPFLWGSGRLNPRLGAVAFWAKGKPPYPGPLFEQSSAAFGRLERDLIGITIDGNSHLGAFLRDARYVRHELVTAEDWDGGAWNHIVLNWDWTKGLELWLNGREIASSWGYDAWFETMYPGLFHLPAAGILYDEVYLMDRPLKPSEVDRLMRTNIPPGIETPNFLRNADDIERIVRVSGADSISGLPSVTPGSIMKMTEVWPLGASDGFIPGWYVIDGRNEMAWPHEYAFFTIIPGDADFHAEKVDVRTPADTRVNYVTLNGNLNGVKVQAGAQDTTDMRDVFAVPLGERFFYGSTIDTVKGAVFRIPFTEKYGVPPGFEGEGVLLPLSGEKRVHEIGLYHAERTDIKPDGERLIIRESASKLDERYDFALKALTARDERRCALASEKRGLPVGTKVNIGSFRRLNIITEPFNQPTGIASITLSLPIRTEKNVEALFIRVHDPAVPSRLWNQFALALKGFSGDFSIMTFVLDIHDLVLTGGDRLWIDIGSAGRCEVELGNSGAEAGLTLTPVPVPMALDAYTDKEITAARCQYCKMYEYMPWKFSGKTVTLEKPYAFGGPFDIIYPALAVLRIKPDHFIANYMELASGQSSRKLVVDGIPPDKSLITLKTFDNPFKAPDWAVYMREFNMFCHRIADWWSLRQNPDGQIGGGWNDDTLFLSFHMAHLPLDCSETARAVIDTVHTKFERTGIFTDGYCKITPIDRLHTGDFISERYNTVVNNLGQTYAAEREMESARHSGHPEQTPLNYGNGGAFKSSVNVFRWYWGFDVPKEAYISKPLEDVTRDLHLFASCLNDFTFFRYTDSYVHTDDYSPYGAHDVYRFLLGGERGARWDAHLKLAVMWPSGAGTDVARIVLKADDTSLKALCYSFDSEKRDLAMRLCRIQDGRYRVSLHSDPNGIGEEGYIIWSEERDLKRFDVVMMPVPPRTPLVIKVDQIERHERPEALPDLAIDPWDAKRSGSHLTAVIHNIGSAPAMNIIVCLMSGGRIIEEKTVNQLEAPVDFVPRRVSVTFTKAPRSQNSTIVIDPGNTIGEILEDNNSITLSGQ